MSRTHGLIAQSVRVFSGRGFKSHSGQLSIAASKNPSVVITMLKYSEEMVTAFHEYNTRIKESGLIDGISVLGKGHLTDVIRNN